MVTNEDIQKLREQTGAGVMACKRALEDARGNVVRAIEYLKEEGIAIAQKKAEREAKQGLVEAYIHGKGRIGVLVEINCETDFVARNPEFKELAHDIAMQISAMEPADINELIKQAFIKDESITIEGLITAKIAKLGENIQIKRFVRYTLGG